MRLDAPGRAYALAQRQPDRAAKRTCPMGATPQPAPRRLSVTARVRSSSASPSSCAPRWHAVDVAADPNQVPDRPTVSLQHPRVPKGDLELADAAGLTRGECTPGELRREVPDGADAFEPVVGVHDASRPRLRHKLRYPQLEWTANRGLRQVANSCHDDESTPRSVVRVVREVEPDLLTHILE